jgi:hypothetical protein
LFQVARQNKTTFKRHFIQLVNALRRLFVCMIPGSLVERSACLPLKDLATLVPELFACPHGLMATVEQDITLNEQVR